MKQFPLAILALTVATSAGCTKKKANSEVVIGSAIYKYDDTFMSGVRSAMSTAAEGKAKIDFVDSANQQPIQSEKVDLFLAKKVNALAINPVDRTAAS
ncbi:MAG: hypothetical protein M3Q07_18605, partial [Pseudobdellovibrionaceae bacterium]|nr:hypothetical protein [Pseudobdellovibrionaceae bacterium]